MFVSLAGENIKYMVGGCWRARGRAGDSSRISSRAVTFALLRIRGHAVPASAAVLMSTFGPCCSERSYLMLLPAGYGLATEIFRLRHAVRHRALPVHLIVTPSAFVGAVILTLCRRVARVQRGRIWTAAREGLAGLG
jgi:hypothetical protein